MASWAPDCDSDVGHELVRWAMDLDHTDIPESIVQNASLRLVDLLGALVAGAHADGVGALRRVVEDWGGRPEAELIGSRVAVPLSAAVLVNATAARALEIDDVHERALLHPSVATVPVGLAIAQKRGDVSSREFLAALIASQEVMCRLGLAPDYHVSGPKHEARGWSFTYQCAVLGGTLLASRLCGLGIEAAMDALGLAYTALAGNQQAVQEGCLGIRVQQGVAAQTAVQSVVFAAAGIDGPRHALEGKFGWLTYWHGGIYSRDSLVGDLGTVWHLESTSIKQYPCCRITHNAIEATIAALVELGTPPCEDIREITVHIESRETWEEVVEPVEQRIRPRTPMGAQFSLPYVIAIAARFGTVSLHHFTEEAITDPMTLNLAERVRPVDNSQTIGGEVGRMIPANVTVEVKATDGGTAYKSTRHPWGHPERPLSLGDVRGKVLDNTLWAYGPRGERISELIYEFVKLENHEFVDAPYIELLRACSTEGPSTG